MWTYTELYSCPLTLIIGKFKHGDLRGYITLPVLNMRVNLLIDMNNNIRVVSNIHNKVWLEELLKICIAIYRDQVNALNVVERILAYTMFYGGLNIHGTYRDKEYLISMDYVNNKRFSFKLTLSKENKLDHISESTLESWLLLQFTLREGVIDLLTDICKNYFEYRDKNCILYTSHGKLEITHSPGGAKGIRIIPDNNPLRHVVSLND
ncbi:MAG: hypothetical protein QXE81_04885 [Desulfurococcaceae archaeon]